MPFTQSSNHIYVWKSWRCLFLLLHFCFFICWYFWLSFLLSVLWSFGIDRLLPIAVSNCKLWRPTCSLLLKHWLSSLHSPKHHFLAYLLCHIWTEFHTESCCCNLLLYRSPPFFVPFRIFNDRVHRQQSADNHGTHTHTHATPNPP